MDQASTAAADALRLRGADLTLADLFGQRVACTPEREAYRQFDPALGRWQSITWGETAARVLRFVRSLDVVGIERGARIGVLLPNGHDAVCIDQAALARACVPVPMHALDNAASIAYILADSAAAVVFVQTLAQWQAVASQGIALPALAWVVVQERPDAGLPPVQGPRLLVLDDWLAAGAAAPASGSPQAPVPGDLAAIVYTSGTTGRPKGVMLTHANVVANVDGALARIEPRPDDVLLSFLPLSHTFERTAGYYLPIVAGCSVAFARSTALLVEDLRTIRPTVLVSVPRIYERVHAQLLERVAGSRWHGLALRLAVAIGWRRFLRAQGRPAPGVAPAWLDDLAWPALDRAVGEPLRATFGGRLRLAVSGGAPLAMPIARSFLALGVPVVQGYGMTETSPVVAANALEDNDPATVGRPLFNVEVRISEQQELQVRGPSVMRGYLGRPEDTARAFVDGWLRTGDQAAIEDGRLRIVGRLKEIIVTAGGEKIAPADVEGAILADPLFGQAWVFGEGRPFIACVVVLEDAAWQRLAASLDLDAAAPGSLSNPAAVAAVQHRIDHLTRGLPRHGQPRKVVLTLAPWTIENSLMTPTLKLKRHDLEARFADAVAALYAK